MKGGQERDLRSDTCGIHERAQLADVVGRGAACNHRGAVIAIWLALRGQFQPCRVAVSRPDQLCDASRDLPRGNVCLRQWRLALPPVGPRIAARALCPPCLRAVTPPPRIVHRSVLVQRRAMLQRSADANLHPRTQALLDQWQF